MVKKKTNKKVIYSCGKISDPRHQMTLFRTATENSNHATQQMQKYTGNNETTNLSLLVTSQLEVLASLDGQHSLGPAVGLHTLQPQYNFLCSLSLE